MNTPKTCTLLAFAVIVGVAVPAHTAAFTVSEGTWPDSWPAELEPLRAVSETIGVASGTQEDIYEIPFKNREQFEALWPVILSLKTRKAPFRLSSIEPKREGTLLSNARPAVRIYAPSGGTVPVSGRTEEEAMAINEEVKKSTPAERDRLELEGKVLRAGPPWPDYLFEPDGALPEYVAAWDGISPAPILPDSPKREWRWYPVDSKFYDLGFHYRARVEIELVVDGEVIDLNRITLPADCPVIDTRFESKGN